MIEIREQLNIRAIERSYGGRNYRALPFNSRHHHNNPKLEDRFPKTPEESKNTGCPCGLTVAGRLTTMRKKTRNGRPKRILGRNPIHYRHITDGGIKGGPFGGSKRDRRRRERRQRRLQTPDTDA